MDDSKVTSLEDLEREAKKEVSTSTWTALRLSGQALGIAKVKYSHDAMIDIIIQNPSVSQGELALAFGYTPGWVSQIIASDAFQARLAERKNELVDPTIRATVEERFKALVIQSLDILRQKLERPAHQISDNLALKGLEVASKALGYGARPEGGNLPPSQPDRLDKLAERLTTLLSQKREGVVLHAVQTEDAQLVEKLG